MFCWWGALVTTHIVLKQAISWCGQLWLSDYLVLRNFTAGCTAQIKMLWVTMCRLGMGDGSPQALLGRGPSSCLMRANRRLRATVEPRSQGSVALTALWSGPGGLLERSQLWLCSVPGGNGRLQALPGRKSNFRNNSGSKPLFAFIPIT